MTSLSKSGDVAQDSLTSGQPSESASAMFSAPTPDHLDDQAVALPSSLKTGTKRTRAEFESGSSGRDNLRATQGESSTLNSIPQPFDTDSSAFAPIDGGYGYDPIDGGYSYNTSDFDSGSGAYDLDPGNAYGVSSGGPDATESTGPYYSSNTAPFDPLADPLGYEEDNVAYLVDTFPQAIVQHAQKAQEAGTFDPSTYDFEGNPDWEFFLTSTKGIDQTNIDPALLTNQDIRNTFKDVLRQYPAPFYDQNSIDAGPSTPTSRQPLSVTIMAQHAATIANLEKQLEEKEASLLAANQRVDNCVRILDEQQALKNQVIYQERDLQKKVKESDELAREAQENLESAAQVMETQEQQTQQANQRADAKAMELSEVRLKAAEIEQRAIQDVATKDHQLQQAVQRIDAIGREQEELRLKAAQDEHLSSQEIATKSLQLQQANQRIDAIGREHEELRLRAVQFEQLANQGVVTKDHQLQQANQRIDTISRELEEFRNDPSAAETQQQLMLAKQEFAAKCQQLQQAIQRADAAERQLEKVRNHPNAAEAQQQYKELRDAMTEKERKWGLKLEALESRQRRDQVEAERVRTDVARKSDAVRRAESKLKEAAEKADKWEKRAGNAEEELKRAHEKNAELVEAVGRASEKLEGEREVNAKLQEEIKESAGHKKFLQEENERALKVLADAAEENDRLRNELATTGEAALAAKGKAARFEAEAKEQAKKLDEYAMKLACARAALTMEREENEDLRKELDSRPPASRPATSSGPIDLSSLLHASPPISPVRPTTRRHRSLHDELGAAVAISNGASEDSPVRDTEGPPASQPPHQYVDQSTQTADSSMRPEPTPATPAAPVDNGSTSPTDLPPPALRTVRPRRPSIQHHFHEEDAGPSWLWLLLALILVVLGLAKGLEVGGYGAAFGAVGDAVEASRAGTTGWWAEDVASWLGIDSALYG